MKRCNKAQKKRIKKIEEDKKETLFEQTNEITSIAKMAKEQQNEVDTMQDEIHDQRTVDFSKVCYEAMNRSNEKKGKRKLRHSRIFLT